MHAFKTTGSYIPSYSRPAIIIGYEGLRGYFALGNFDFSDDNNESNCLSLSCAKDSSVYLIKKPKDKLLLATSAGNQSN